MCLTLYKNWATDTPSAALTANFLRGALELRVSNMDFLSQFTLEVSETQIPG